MRNLIFALVLCTAAPALAAPLDDAAMLNLLKDIDHRQAENGDYRSTVFIIQKETDKPDVAQQAVVYRREEGQKLMITFEQPKEMTGQGYLRIEHNLWFYDPSVGKWERRTEREKIGGTNSRREDFDESKLAEEYTPSFVGEEQVGKYKAWHVKLSAKPNIDVAFPVVELWVDEATGNILKRYEYALSGRLMRRLLYPSWDKLYSDSKKGDVWFPKQIFIFDEVEKANQTQITIKDVDLHPLEANLFTKAYLESKSR
ncbi:MAG: outer membrane lipoprotein-sorting protein [Deltaproteobacteria bacterium]|nr:outer membrane lipoprotein-sorting protein [Deltaproteobacteria bacterium]